MDDLYDGWAGLRPSLEPRVLAQVVVPLAAGRAARWQGYDWSAGAFGGWHDLPLPTVLVLEGCGSGARAYAAYSTLLVWVEAEPATRLQRATARDGAAVLAHWAAWTASEERHFALNDTAALADLVLTT